MKCAYRNFFGAMNQKRWSSLFKHKLDTSFQKLTLKGQWIKANQSYRFQLPSVRWFSEEQAKNFKHENFLQILPEWTLRKTKMTSPISISCSGSKILSAMTSGCILTLFWKEELLEKTEFQV